MRTRVLSCLASSFLILGCSESGTAPVEAGPAGDENGVMADLVDRAENGDAEARFDLATLYEREGDYENARVWYRSAVEQGSVDAHVNLGRMYFEGTGVEQDDGIALDLFQAAAAKGDSRAQYNIGRMFEEGRGVPKDRESALTWLRLAADQGFADAQNHLGAAYNNAPTPDYEKAKEWYWLACKQGHAHAQFNLGVMYYNGDGLAVDHARAYHWIYLASEGGHEGAQQSLATVAGKLSPKEIEEIQESSKDWTRRLASLSPL